MEREKLFLSEYQLYFLTSRPAVSMALIFFVCGPRRSLEVHSFSAMRKPANYGEIYVCHYNPKWI